MNDEEVRKELARVSIIHATPLDYDKLIKDGVIKKIGKSYYTDNSHKLPDDVEKKIKQIGTKTKNGNRLTFYKDTSIKKATEELKEIGFSEKSIKEMIQKQKQIKYFLSH